MFIQMPLFAMSLSTFGISRNRTPRLYVERSQIPRAPFSGLWRFFFGSSSHSVPPPCDWARWTGAVHADGREHEL
jgi:hypothetical protein